MDELTVSAQHEAAHAAAALLHGVHVESTTINANGRGGGVTLMTAHGDGEGMAISIAAGLLAEGCTPAWPPSNDSASRDVRQLSELANSLNLDEHGWTKLMDKAVDLTQQSTFVSLKGAIALLLLKHGEVSETQLQRLLAATKSKDHDDEDIANERDELGCLTDRALDHALAVSRANEGVRFVPHYHDEVSTNGHGPEDLNDVKGAAYDAIIAVHQAA